MIKPGRCFSNQLPSYLHHFCTKYGGLNRYGDPAFRIVWSGNECEWHTSKFIDKDKNGDFLRETYETRWVLKYRKAYEQERWIIERWKAPESLGTPEEWYAKRLILDVQKFLMPKEFFPSRGVYKKVDVVSDGDGEYLEPTEAYLKDVIDAVKRLDNLKASEHESNVNASNKRQTDESIEKMVMKMKERSRSFYGPTIGYGASFNEKTASETRPIWTEADVPKLRGKLGHQFTDEWALETPEHYFNY